MEWLSEQSESCPYCGEPISIVIDCSVPEQSYVEDCQVCCQPMLVDVSIDTTETIRINLRQENN